MDIDTRRIIFTKHYTFLLELRFWGQVFSKLCDIAPSRLDSLPGTAAMKPNKA